MQSRFIEQIKINTRKPDQSLAIGDLVYSEYYGMMGRISRLSKSQEIEGNPSYVLSDPKDPQSEILFGVREHNWHYTHDGNIKYSRLVKLNEWKNFVEYSPVNGKPINQIKNRDDEVIITCNHCGRSHLANYCSSTGKIPSIDCATIREDDHDISNFFEYFREK